MFNSRSYRLRLCRHVALSQPLIYVGDQMKAFNCLIEALVGGRACEYIGTGVEEKYFAIHNGSVMIPFVLPPIAGHPAHCINEGLAPSV